MATCAKCGMENPAAQGTCVGCGAGLVEAGVTAAAGNTSGQGAAAAVPAEIRGWNWGAFLLTWVWGIGNQVWISFLCFVPLLNVVWFFVLGAKGSEWAWQNRRFESVEQFRKVQRAWAIWGLIILLISLAIAVGMMVMMFAGAAAAANSGAFKDLEQSFPK